MCLDVLLEVLWPLEGLATEVAFVRLQRYVDADVRGDMIAFHGGRAACTPLTGEVEVVGALAADMALADVILDACQPQARPHDGDRKAWRASLNVTSSVEFTYVESFWSIAAFAAALPLAGEVIDGAALPSLQRLHRRRWVRNLLRLLLCRCLNSLRYSLRSCIWIHPWHRVVRGLDRYLLAEIFSTRKVEGKTCRRCMRLLTNRRHVHE